MATGALAGCSTDTSDDTDTPDDGGDGGSGEPDWPSYLDGVNEDTYEDMTGEDEVTIAVENFYFDPTKITVDSGTTVVWEFNTAGHNVKPESQPSDNFEGTSGGAMELIEQGETHSEELESTGIYTYYCAPHENQDMKGGIQVV